MWWRSLMERYEDFWSVTRTALRSAARELQLEVNEAQLRSPCKPISVCVSACKASSGIVEGPASGHPVEWFTADVGVRGPSQRSGIHVCRDQFSGSSADVQTVSPRLRAGNGNSAPSGASNSVRLIKTGGTLEELRRSATRFAGATDPKLKWSSWTALPTSRVTRLDQIVDHAQE